MTFRSNAEIVSFLRWLILVFHVAFISFVWRGCHVITLLFFISRAPAPHTHTHTHTHTQPGSSLAHGGSRRVATAAGLAWRRRRRRKLLLPALAVRMAIDQASQSAEPPILALNVCRRHHTHAHAHTEGRRRQHAYISEGNAGAAFDVHATRTLPAAAHHLGQHFFSVLCEDNVAFA